jgi:hypothetical protein
MIAKILKVALGCFEIEPWNKYVWQNHFVGLDVHFADQNISRLYSPSMDTSRNPLWLEIHPGMDWVIALIK